MHRRGAVIGLAALALLTAACDNRTVVKRGPYITTTVPQTTTTTRPQCRDARVPSQTIPCPQVGGVTERVTVPAVIGMPQDQAEMVLGQRAILSTVRPVYSDAAPSGVVVAERPPAGSTVSDGSTVLLLVSAGPCHDPAQQTTMKVPCAGA